MVAWQIRSVRSHKCNALNNFEVVWCIRIGVVFFLFLISQTYFCLSKFMDVTQEEPVLMMAQTPTAWTLSILCNYMNSRSLIPYTGRIVSNRYDFSVVFPSTKERKICTYRRKSWAYKYDAHVLISNSNNSWAERSIMNRLVVTLNLRMWKSTTVAMQPNKSLMKWVCIKYNPSERLRVHKQCCGNRRKTFWVYSTDLSALQPSWKRLP